MGVVRARKETGLLFLDFRWNGKRCREQTELKDTAANRRKLERMLLQIESEIQLGRFRYEAFFPERHATEEPVSKPLIEQQPILDPKILRTPLLKDFLEEWLAETSIGWRRSYLVTIRGNVDKYYLPAFGNVRVGAITRADLLKFRSSLAKVSGRNGNATLSANRINKIMDPLRRIFEEAADRL